MLIIKTPEFFLFLTFQICILVFLIDLIANELHWSKTILYHLKKNMLNSLNWWFENPKKIWELENNENTSNTRPPISNNQFWNWFYEHSKAVLKLKSFLIVILIQTLLIFLAIILKNKYIIEYNMQALQKATYWQYFIYYYWPYNLFLILFLPFFISILFYRKDFPRTSNFLLIWLSFTLESKSTIYIPINVLNSFFFEIPKKATENLENILYQNKYFQILYPLDFKEFITQIKEIYDFKFKKITQQLSFEETSKCYEKLKIFYNNNIEQLWTYYINTNFSNKKINQEINKNFEIFKKNIIDPLIEKKIQEPDFDETIMQSIINYFLICSVPEQITLASSLILCILLIYFFKT